jgi:hypothetical protein
VKPDYPHDEIRNPGVNHFPDGVFQKCRIVMKREKDAERERLKKMKRTKAQRQLPPTRAIPVTAASPQVDAWRKNSSGSNNAALSNEGNDNNMGSKQGSFGTANPLLKNISFMTSFDDRWNKALGTTEDIKQDQPSEIPYANYSVPQSPFSQSPRRQLITPSRTGETKEIPSRSSTPKRNKK